VSVGGVGRAPSGCSGISVTVGSESSGQDHNTLATAHVGVERRIAIGRITGRRELHCQF
jgi:hypothetical protein